MKYILIIITLFLISCQSSKNITKSRFNLVDNGHTIQVYNGELTGQLVDNKSFIIDETTYYDKNYEIISSSREGFLYPNYLEVYDENGNYIGDIRIIKTFFRNSPMFVIIINDLMLSKTYKSNEFLDFSRPIILYENGYKVSSIRNYNNKWSIIFYEDMSQDLIIHIFRFIRGGRFTKSF